MRPRQRRSKTFPSIAGKFIRGITLAELLTCIWILGLIAAFSIPKMVYAVSSQQKKAIMKESLATVNAIMFEGMTTGALRTTNFSTYFLSKVNAVKLCPNNSSTEGCWNQAIQIENGADTTSPGFILSNGAYLTGFDNCCNLGSGEWVNGIVIDYNGLAGPNVAGDDQHNFHLCYGTRACTTWGSNVERGRFGYYGTSWHAYFQ